MMAEERGLKYDFALEICCSRSRKVDGWRRRRKKGKVMKIGRVKKEVKRIRNAFLLCMKRTCAHEEA